MCVCVCFEVVGVGGQVGGIEANREDRNSRLLDTCPCGLILCIQQSIGMAEQFRMRSASLY